MKLKIEEIVKPYQDEKQVKWTKHLGMQTAAFKGKYDVLAPAGSYDDFQSDLELDDDLNVPVV